MHGLARAFLSQRVCIFFWFIERVIILGGSQWGVRFVKKKNYVDENEQYEQNQETYIDI